MPRKNIYFKDRIDREIEGILEIERQKGATPSESSYSSMVNELVRLGLMVYKSREDGDSLDLEGFRRDVIKKVAGSREGIMILTAMVSEMYMGHKGLTDMAQLDALISENITAINSAEAAAENQHFVTDK
ncbi:relaxosome protein TraM [Cronobacter sakazakii]|uniref:relaxosome protein TraM n=1 Tax=Cronobacter sakazakii TaxID=28141 RepID=UPI002DC039D0|nr:relaxosome protein TraM [Cronobacter sakazakii]MEB8610145.1 relaxosome protein TraM [Cronobacter sakazakii]